MFSALIDHATTNVWRKWNSIQRSVWWVVLFCMTSLTFTRTGSVRFRAAAICSLRRFVCMHIGTNNALHLDICTCYCNQSGQQGQERNLPDGILCGRWRFGVFHIRSHVALVTSWQMICWSNNWQYTFEFAYITLLANYDKIIWHVKCWNGTRFYVQLTGKSSILVKYLSHKFFKGLDSV